MEERSLATGVLCDEGGPKREAGIRLPDLRGVRRQRCAAEISPALEVTRVETFLALAGRGALSRGGLLQRGEVCRAVVDLAPEISEVGFDSATAEVGPGSRVVEIEGNLHVAPRISGFGRAPATSGVRGLPRVAVSPHSMRMDANGGASRGMWGRTRRRNKAAAARTHPRVAMDFSSPRRARIRESPQGELRPRSLRRRSPPGDRHPPR